MLLWLFALHVWELTFTFAEVTVASLPALLVEGQCDAVFKVSVEAFKESPSFPLALTEYFNSGKTNCLEQVLEAYFEKILLPEWQSVPTPLDYKGVLSKSAPIPDTFYPVNLPSADVNSEHKSQVYIDIAGQSKQPDSDPFFLSLTKHTQPGGKMVWNFGEDAVGISPALDLFVVCDGVGGASHSEIVSFSLTYLALSIFTTETTKTAKTDPKLDLLAASDKLIQSLQAFLQRSRFTGSTTFLAAQVDREADQVKIVNVGDCTAMLVNDRDQVVLLTAEQWYAPNTPYQLNSSPLLFKPHMAARYTVSTGSHGNGGGGMRLVLGSDGVGDNVWPLQAVKARDAADLLAMARAQAAGAIGANIPFSKKMGWSLSGKMDDMSAVFVYL